MVPFLVFFSFSRSTFGFSTNLVASIAGSRSKVMIFFETRVFSIENARPSLLVRVIESRPAFSALEESSNFYGSTVTFDSTIAFMTKSVEGCFLSSLSMRRYFVTGPWFLGE